VKRLQDEPEPRFRKFINGSGSSSDARWDITWYRRLMKAYNHAAWRTVYKLCS
jgi:hypothetical protein